jgi:ABC-type branched-subunit amino acid transport system ATPase component
MSALEVRGGRAGYDGRRSVVQGVDLTVRSGEFVAILGSNGVGKTTLMRALMGLCRWQGGSIHLGGREVTRMSTRRRVRAQMAIVPQGQELFPDLSVEDNLRAGALDLGRRENEAAFGRVYEAFPKLAERKSQLASTLSGGERALVAVGRALMSGPSMLLLDEPSLGLSPGTRAGVFDYLKQLAASEKLSILLAEQDVSSTLRVAERCYGMRGGRVLGWLGADEIAAEDLRDLYMGGEQGRWQTFDAVSDAEDERVNTTADGPDATFRAVNAS